MTNTVPGTMPYLLSPALIRTLPKSSQALLQALQEVTNEFIKAADLNMPPRLILPGTAPTAEAWTDGETFIAFNTKLLIADWRLNSFEMHNPREIDPRPMCIKLTQLLAHELCHTTPSSDPHNHNKQFYAAFHELVMHPAFLTLSAQLQSSWMWHLVAAGEAVPQEFLGSAHEMTGSEDTVRTLRGWYGSARGPVCVRSIHWSAGHWLVIEPRAGEIGAGMLKTPTIRTLFGTDPAMPCCAVPYLKILEQSLDHPTAVIWTPAEPRVARKIIAEYKAWSRHLMARHALTWIQHAEEWTLNEDEVD